MGEGRGWVFISHAKQAKKLAPSYKTRFFQDCFETEKKNLIAEINQTNFRCLSHSKGVNNLFIYSNICAINDKIWREVLEQDKGPLSTINWSQIFKSFTHVLISAFPSKTISKIIRGDLHFFSLFFLWREKLVPPLPHPLSYNQMNMVVMLYMYKCWPIEHSK